MNFSEKLRKLMAEKQTTAYRISKDTGISAVTISDWLAERYDPKLEKLRALAEYFEVPLSYFLE